MTCEHCGLELRIGDYPFCPHGAGFSNVIGDEIDLWQENGFRHPQHFTSKIERKRALKAAGLQEVVKNAGPDDKHCPRWVTVDARTLENARILVSRASTYHGKDVDVPVKMHVTYVSGEGIA